MPKRKPKVGIYCRCSTQKQTNRQQRHAIREWMKSSHISESEVKWFEDKMSGKALKGRSGLQRLLKAVDAGSVDTAVFYDLSRISRNLLEGLQVLAELAKKVRVVSVSESIDFSSNTGMLIAQILLSVAEWSRKNQNEKIRQGLAAAKASGKVLGRPRDHKKHEKIQALRSQGLSLQDVADQLGCTRQNIHSALKKMEAA